MDAYLISIWKSSRTRRAFDRLSSAFPRLRWIVSPGVQLNESEISYASIRDMECYKSWDVFRSGYPARAAGCRAAGLNALAIGLQNATVKNDDRFAIFQDDAVPVVDAASRLESLEAVNGGDWDCLWLDDGQITGPVDEDRRLHGARLCTGMVLRTWYAEDLLARLVKAACEWDVWMEREMRTGRKYFVDSIVYQEEGVSEITGATKWERRGTE